MKWINRLYIFFLGIILSITTGFGLAAFYPQPILPAYPTSLYSNTVPTSCNATPEAQASAECQSAFAKQRQTEAQDELRRQQYEETMTTYRNESAGYNRTAIFLGIVIGAIFAVLGIGLIKISKLVANGLLLAGILTALLTRLLINLASLGTTTSGTSGADSLAYIEFSVLFVLSVVVIIIGLFSLKEHSGQPANTGSQIPPIPQTV